MNGPQLSLFDPPAGSPTRAPALAPEPPASSRPTSARGPKGLVMALLRQGLDPDAIEPAARLALLLDSEAARETDSD